MATSKMRLVSLTLLALLFFVFSFSDDDRLFQIAKNMEVFSNIIQEINQNYVEDINPADIMQDGISVMLSQLDPYTVYIPEDKIENFRTSTSGIYAGVGIVVLNKGGYIVVHSVREGYPAEEAGIEIGDTIVSVNKIAIEREDTEKAMALIKGQASTKVNLGVRRYGHEETLKYEVMRENIRITNVPFVGMIDEEVGLIKLTEFSRNASKEVINGLKNLKTQGVKKLILDLRNNPGGLLNEAVSIVNIFIPRNKVVVEVRGKLKRHTFVHKTNTAALDNEIPIVVLINGNSASASEIVAGVVQDYDRGVVIGERSFGKGLVQQTFPLKYNGQLKVTIAKYYTPSGRCIQEIEYSKNKQRNSGEKPTPFYTTNQREVYEGNGILPDIQIEDDQTSQLVRELLQSDEIFKYASKYKFEHKTLSDSTNFELENKELEGFIEKIPNSVFKKLYEDVYASIEKIKLHSDKVGVAKAIDEQMQQVSKTLKLNKPELTAEEKKEIKKSLEKEIIRRYYFFKGSFTASLDEDPMVQKAIEILANQEDYKKMLGL